MQFDLQRAFPYPVLRPNVDDYIEGDIQTTVDFRHSEDNTELTAEIRFVVSVPEIVEQIAAGKAHYVCVFACRDTYFRKATRSQEGHFAHVFKAGDLRGHVIIYPFVIANQNIARFESAWINPEFGAGPFSFVRNAVLAVDEPQAIYIDRDTFKPISSCFVLVKKDSLADNEWAVEPSNDKVQIAVSKTLKDRIDSARNNTKNRAILLNSIYFGAVMQCLALLKDKDKEEFEQFRWANVFKQRIADLKIKIEAHPESYIAQQLMKHPFSLIDTYFFGEKPE